MYQSKLIDGLLRQDQQTTLTQTVTWSDSSIWKILFQKIRHWSLSEENINHIYNTRCNEILSSYNQNYNSIAAKLIHDLADTAEVEINGMFTEKGLSKIGKEIEDSAIEKLRKNTKGDFDGSSLQDMIKYIIKQMLERLESQYEKKSEKEKKKITRRLLEIIDELPPSEVEKLKEELGVDQITEKAVRNALSAGVFSIAIASAINLGGFGSYMFAVKALAAVTGFFGITLPFGVYTALTSWMAALSNPILVIPAVFGFGWWMNSKANKKIREALLPQYVVQIALASQKDDIVLDAKEIAKFI